MSAIETRFLEPLDVLFLRGNKLFGDPGSHGESLVPPWPSVAAGALRSRMLADEGVDLAAFAVTAFHLARRRADGKVEILIQPPADLVIGEGEDGKPSVRALSPTPLPLAGEGQQIASSAPFPLLPVLAETARGKPVSGYWLTESGWKRYQAGETPQAADLVKTSMLWQIDPRVGVGLDAATHRTTDGRLFSVQAVAMVERGHRIGTNPETDRPILSEYDVGFLAAIRGAAAPANGTLRLGGDGRAAAVHVVSHALPEPDYTAIAQAGRCRLALATPGIFAEGWKLPGMAADNTFQLGEVRARVVCAAVPRAEIVSGWDLAKRQPKTAQRATPTGSVYWLENLEATPEALRKLAETGLWNAACDDPQRRAEGFNRIWLASW